MIPLRLFSVFRLSLCFPLRIQLRLEVRCQDSRRGRRFRGAMKTRKLGNESKHPACAEPVKKIEEYEYLVSRYQYRFGDQDDTRRIEFERFETKHGMMD